MGGAKYGGGSSVGLRCGSPMKKCSATQGICTSESTANDGVVTDSSLVSNSDDDGPNKG